MLFPIVIALSVLPFLPAASASEQRAEARESGAGAAVAVDTTGAGGSGLDVRCAAGDPGDARTALERAGLAVEAGARTGAYGDRDHACRVEGLPAAGLGAALLIPAGGSRG